MFAIAVGALLTLSGCFSMTGDLTVNSDAKVSGTMKVAMNKELASAAGISSLDAFKAGVTSDSGSLPKGSAKFSETSTDYVVDVKIDNATMNDAQGFIVTKVGQDVVFKMVNEKKSADTPDLGQINLTIHLPGAIKSISGKGLTKVDDTTAKISAPGTTGETFVVTSLATSPTNSTGVYAAIGVGVVIVVAIVGLLLVLRSRKVRGESGSTPPTAEATQEAVNEDVTVGAADAGAEDSL
jgi:hypothetical protein